MKLIETSFFLSMKQQPIQSAVPSCGEVSMRAIVIKRPGGPEVLTIEDRPDPKPEPGYVVIDVKAFGLNQAEVYLRKGA
jgi:hypothetical protein